MSAQDCPNCGNKIPTGASGCTCGFSVQSGVEVPAPAIVRSKGTEPGKEAWTSMLSDLSVETDTAGEGDLSAQGFLHERMAKVVKANRLRKLL